MTVHHDEAMNLVAPMKLSKQKIDKSAQKEMEGKHTGHSNLIRTELQIAHSFRANTIKFG